MFKTSKIVLLVVALIPILFFFISCDDDGNSVSDLTGTRADISAMLQSDDIVQRVSLDSDDFRYVSNAGNLISAEPNSFIFRNGGALVTGMIDFELTELFSKSEILRYGIPTQTTDAILESDGEFLFAASQNGEPLRLASGKDLNVIVPNPEPNPQMELFREGEGLWWPLGDSLNVINVDGISAYDFSFDRLDWVNIDYFTKFDLELTDISICLPGEYEDENIALFIVFRDMDVVLSSSGQNLPVGEVVSIVCLAAVDEDTFRIDIQEVTVEKDLKVNLDPKEESVETIKKLIKELD